MPFLEINVFSGDSAELLASKSKVDAKLQTVGGDNWPLEHLVGGNDHGITIVNVWKSEADAKSFKDVVMPLAMELGMPKPDVYGYETANTPSLERLLASV